MSGQPSTGQWEIGQFAEIDWSWKAFGSRSGTTRCIWTGKYWVLLDDLDSIGQWLAALSKVPRLLPQDIDAVRPQKLVPQDAIVAEQVPLEDDEVDLSDNEPDCDHGGSPVSACWYCDESHGQACPPEQHAHGACCAVACPGCVAGQGTECSPVVPADSAAALLREIAERDPVAHDAALARAYGAGPAIGEVTVGDLRLLIAINTEAGKQDEQIELLNNLCAAVRAQVASDMESDLWDVANRYSPEAVGLNSLPVIMEGIARQRDNQHEIKDHLADVARRLTEERNDLLTRNHSGAEEIQRVVAWAVKAPGGNVYVPAASSVVDPDNPENLTATGGYKIAKQIVERNQGQGGEWKLMPLVAGSQITEDKTQ